MGIKEEESGLYANLPPPPPSGTWWLWQDVMLQADSWFEARAAIAAITSRDISQVNPVRR